MKILLISLFVFVSCFINANPFEVVDELLRKSADRGYQGIVQISRNGQTLFERIDGDFNIHTRFELASITKHFVAVGILTLVEQGKMNLQDPISKFIKTPKMRGDITIVELLSHRSGLSYPTMKEVFELDPYDEDLMYKMLELSPMDEKKNIFL